MSHVCRHCGQWCLPDNKKLSDWEIREVADRARNIFQRFPVSRGRIGDGRNSHLRQLADEYGISQRTVYRYLRRAA